MSSKNKLRIPLSKTWMGESEVLAAERAIRSGWVTQGPEVAAFEKEFAEFVGAPHACAVSSCTTALHLALKVVGVDAGDEVITVSHSFIATANSIRYCGAIPVFIDIRPEDFNLNPSLVEAVITPRTRAILCVHQLGMPCDLTALAAIAKKHNLPLIEDAACALGSEILFEGKWEKIGKPHGDIACFSFHPRKLLSTGDGGMITTKRGEWDAKFRLWRQHGMTVPDTLRHSSSTVLSESYSELGFNYRMTDIQAAIGRSQLLRIPEMVARRRSLAENYHRLLGKIPGLKVPKELSNVRGNYQSYCIRLPDDVDQKKFMQSLLDGGIASRRGVMCTHREPAYAIETWSCGAPRPGKPCGPGSCERLVESERAQDESVNLPIFHELSEIEQKEISVSVASACSEPKNKKAVPKSERKVRYGT